MANVQFEFIGLEDLRKAIQRTPQNVKKEVSNFLVRALAVYRRIITNDPWRIGGSGGGAPEKTGNLSGTHGQEVHPWSARIFPNLQEAPYARFVHDGTKYMRPRPWLDFAAAQAEGDITNLEEQLVANIVTGMAQ